MSTRLPGSKYKSVFDRGSLYRGRLFSVWVLRSPHAGRQAGVVVSKKSFRHAVDRNRAKRIMREAFRLCSTEIQEEALLVMVGRSSLGGKSTSDVQSELRYLARRYGFSATQRRDGRE
jgi:ribonuclease P protein component